MIFNIAHTFASFKNYIKKLLIEKLNVLLLCTLTKFSFIPKTISKVTMRSFGQFWKNFVNKTYSSTQRNIIFINKKFTFYPILFLARKSK